MTDFQIILCTCADREQAERIAHRMVPRFPVEIGGVAELHAAFREVDHRLRRPTGDETAFDIGQEHSRSLHYATLRSG